MENTQKTTFLQRFIAARESKPIATVNKWCASPIGLSFFALLTLIGYLFSLELLVYSVVVAYVLYVCLFGEDFYTIIPLFLFCYVASAPENNPARIEFSLYYGGTGIAILILAAVAVTALLLRVGLDKNMGFKRLFTKKRKLALGFAALATAFFLSGIGSAGYLDLAWKNLFFALLQALGFGLIYFFFSATVNWEKRDKNYFAWAILIVGVLVALEMFSLFIFCGIVTDGTIDRSISYTGWGNYNNIGAMITLAVPFAFYLSLQYKRGFLLLIPAALLTAAVFFSCSRSSSVVVALGFVGGYILTAIKTKEKLPFFITTGALLTALAVLCIIFHEYLGALFAKLPLIFNGGNPDISPDYIGRPAGTGNDYGGFLGLFNDAKRFEIYGEGLNVFLKYPVFGETFYPQGYQPGAFATLQGFNGFFPPRWHNTFIQLLASCGAVGLIAYLFHRVQTVLLFFKSPSLFKTFIGIGVLLLLLMSMLDCHLFNIGPAFFYSACLLFAEFADKKDEANPTTTIDKEGV